MFNSNSSSSNNNNNNSSSSSSCCCSCCSCSSSRSCCCCSSKMSESNDIYSTPSKDNCSSISFEEIRDVPSPPLSSSSSSSSSKKGGTSSGRSSRKNSFSKFNVNSTPIISRSGSIDSFNDGYTTSINRKGQPINSSSSTCSSNNCYIGTDNDTNDEDTPIDYFVVENPTTIINSIGASEYNIAKGAVTGPLILVTAPIAGAVDGFDSNDPIESFKGITIGFTKGLARGVIGSFALFGTGIVTGVDQIKKGIMDTDDAPGQGHSINENIEHIVNTPSLDLAFNIEPSNFKEDVEEHFNGDKNLKYQFFHNSDPKNIVNGLGQSQYNVAKGTLSASTLLVVAPIKDTIDGYNENGYEGSFKGMGSGIFRSIFGSMALISAGVITGTSQLLGSILSYENIPAAIGAANSIKTDFYHILRTPIYRLVNGHRPSSSQHDVNMNTDN